MTRVTVYSAALIAFLAATSMTISSIVLPNWISYSIPSSDSASIITRTLGLHDSCTSSPLSSALVCTKFPTYDDCRGDDRYFCSMWRSVGWMMSVGAVMELATIVAFVVILAGGKPKREGGWTVVTFLLVLVGLLQCAGMAIVAYLFDNDTERFFVGWTLDTSFYLCTASWSIAILAAAGISLSAFIFPPEDGYELIPSERVWG